MPKLIVSIDGIVVKEVQVTRERSTIGRRPYNDIVIDNLAVSGEHAVIHLSSGQASLEDLGSTNGTFVNGKAIKKQVLSHDDIIEVGKYKIKFLNEDGASFSTGLAAPPEPIPATSEALAPSLGADTTPAVVSQAVERPRVRVLTGTASGREMLLTKVVTTIGKPGLSVASIIRKPHGCELSHVEGDIIATVNGVSVQGAPTALKNHDQIELGGIRLEFLDH
ncbi:FHA domain-containing protein [Ottowia sp.]|uniref:FHA domain-containing protein n=1 Tax=Ottowia sp. TaxID=1898956 RepID=UPI003A86F09C